VRERGDRSLWGTGVLAGARRRGRRRPTVIVASLIMLLAPALSACPVCYGAGPGPATDGLNNAIIFLLIIVGLVQAGFIALFWSFRKRAKALQARRESFRVLEGGA